MVSEAVSTKIIILVAIMVILALSVSVARFTDTAELSASAYLVSKKIVNDKQTLVISVKVHNKMNKPLHLKKVSIKYISDSGCDLCHELTLVYRDERGWGRYVQCDVIVDGISMQSNVFEFGRLFNERKK